MDIFATALDVAGVPEPKDIDGVSFLPVLFGQNQTLDRYNYFIRRESGKDFQDGKPALALRLGPWKILQNRPVSKVELYNLSSDPMESKDMAKENRDEYQILLKKLMNQFEIGNKIPFKKPNSVGSDSKEPEDVQ